MTPISSLPTRRRSFILPSSRFAFSINIILALLCSIFSGQSINAQSDTVLGQATALSVALPDGSPLDWSDTDLTWLDGWADTPILAFGEATHGARTFTRARLRSFQYLVEHHGYRAVAFEAHFTEMLFLERCMEDPACDLAARMKEHMPVWVTVTREMLGVLEWVRAHNRGLPPEDRVRLVGIDAQVQRRIPELLSSLLGPARSELSHAVAAAYDPLEGLARADYEAMDSTTLQTHLNRLAALRRAMEAADLESRLGVYQAACAFQSVRVTEQSLEFLQKYLHSGVNVRDRHLRENVAWISSTLGAGAKMVLWAHNAHIARDPGYGGGAGGSMGWQLAEIYGSQYKALALTFTRGEFRAKVIDGEGNEPPEARHIVLVVDPPEDSLNRLLDRISGPRFVLPLDVVAHESPLGRYLNQPMAILGVGDLWTGYGNIRKYNYGGDRIMNPLQAFDGIIHLEGTESTEPLG